MLLAVPKYGRVKVNKILQQCRISPQQDDRRPVRAPARRARPAAAGDSSRRLRHHRPLGGRQGHADPQPAASGCRSCSCRCRRRRVRRGRASARRRLLVPVRRRLRATASRSGDFVEHASTPAAATALCARSSSVAPLRACRSCSRSRSRARGRSARRCRRRSRSSSRRRRSRRCARGSSAAAPTTPTRSSAGCDREVGARRPGRVRRRRRATTGSSDGGGCELEAIVQRAS